MRIGVSGTYRRTLARGAAVLLIGGTAAGCSSDVSRFQDSILTGSARQQQIAPVNQPYPGDTAQLDQTTTASIAPARRGSGILNRFGRAPRPDGDVRSGAAQVAATPMHSTWQQQQPTYAAPAAPAPQPVVQRASLDTTATGSTAPAPQPAAPAVQPPVVQAAQPVPAAPRQPEIASRDNEGGWSRAGGTQVPVRQGETVYNLSRRFGVPVDAILKANGLSSADALAAGQQVIIPTYVHSAKAPVSAPDANSNVADARSSTGSRFDVPNDRVPVPGKAPAERLAVLPQQPKLKEEQPGTQTAANDTQRGAANGRSYTVASGDTLNAIARRTGVSAEALKQANGLSSGLIRIGQTLTIPAAGAPVQVAQRTDQTTTGTVKPSAPEPVAAYTPPKQAQPAEKVIQQASLNPESAPDATGISRMRWPARGRVISGFGGSSGGKKNDGIDIAVPTGTSVRAAENGVVIYAGDGLKEFGNTVLVRHENGLVTVYGHASEINVQRGQKVRRGEEIAKAGMSGSADTPKLHFEVRKDSAPVDPAGYLE
ncbi:peptidoglycan DD-metalloendopeptidase family protein [Neoaquamicrobium sediminum]|uniref:peptidoglycan DD-metalloendopeptidase family protein n=1 Tax=Neoaquamicrobium sediminum TaxID=1849104 RepID=UPI0015662087|nr:peptidoglycan DD-metalloendopeptidase family protein [Mesorhizobium sediminum]NRC55293.1 peptidoglycan DD-metalloendopeptidase family protein [Mesorhizobium sediminum]